ncbi:PFL family protein [Fuchsiella alkaliacetigena]|uniref:PFL family protein n=1 Tax=Fuchsiella alkaliacetigena TaxID=957042 RepID=UPI00200B98A4|nr:PFL family protein [Fuchsiella alkaliacetigena]MCK8824135.1 PFL family protein [Fuchsiella alkaliacetigena]
MLINPDEILETIKMIEMENFDIRTVTMGINLKDCAHPDIEVVRENIYNKIIEYAGQLVETAQKMEVKYGVPIVNKRISVTPISIVAAACEESDYSSIAETLDQAAKKVGVDFIGGFSALVHKGHTKEERNLINSIPKALNKTDRVCSSVNVATTKAGINMDAVLEMGQIIKKTAELTADEGAIGCAKLVVFANVPEDNPFMAGAFHGIGEAEATINVGISGPGVIKNIVEDIPEVNFDELADRIKRTAFKITRMGELVGRGVSKELAIPFGIVDLSLAPTPAVGDSIANILENMGLEKCGTHGTTAALALLNDAVKKGGAMASAHVGGLSGAFIPVSEDQGMIEAVESGALDLNKLEAMTSVCSVGLDMIAIPGATSAETIAAIIADEMAIGTINQKTTAARIIPVPGKEVGDEVEFGGLLGRAPIMDINHFSSAKFVKRGGRIPAPLQALNN